ncbi:hypothetical protein KAJ89_04730 [Candidatus Parcubacteria bacterium]|nr:hypothetical protein [Candidatus Parcubacteria bacterium]
MKLPSPFKFKKKVVRIFNFFNKIVFNKYIGIALLVFVFSFSVASMVLAGNIFTEVKDSVVKQAVEQIDKAKKEAEAAKDKKQSLGSKLFQATLGQALNLIAYETATWVGSGGEGQKPQFLTEERGEYFKNMADNAAGSFIETLGQENGFLKLNLCKPDFSIKLKIGLGLVRQQRPTAPTCSFSKMKENWEKALDKDTFLNDFQDIFDPTSNDLGIALTLHTGVMQDMSLKSEEKKSEIESNEGWLDIRNVAGKLEGAPGWAKKKSEDVLDGPVSNIGKWTGAILVDAANIFLNQLAVTAIDTLMKKLAGDQATSEPYPGDWGGLLDYEAGPSQGGIAGAKDRFRELVKPRFNTRGDYNILTELSICPNPTKAGPTNCVLSDRFRQAIEARITLGQAIDDDYLNVNGIFGFTAGGMEPPYNEGYPYRSMIILRKFRILPVGWEIAAQFIRDNSNQANGTKNLGDMVACFAADDDYEGYYAGWCEGLVDPSWVLKAPQNYCKREGPGPEIISEAVTGSGVDSRLALGRNDTYCADEQACIKEDRDGACELFGYCTEERRTWDFGDGRCEPRYNTCQTFRSREGQTASYLENTLDYSICSLDNVGCEAYCQDYDNINNTFTCAVGTGNALFADSDIEECDSEAEGCHEFIRTKSGVGANLLINSSFEDIAFTDIVDDALPDTFDSWGMVGLAVSESYHGTIGLELQAGGFSTTVPVGASGFSLAGQIMTLSFYAKDCQAGDRLELDTSSTTLSATNDWQYYSVTHIYPPTTTGLDVDINIITNSCVIDAIKLEFGSTGSSYGDYRQAGLINQKLAPDYLGCSGANPGAECSQFVRECGPSEVGCELYASASDGLTVPAQVTTEDYCPAACVGYDEYLQTSTYFDSVATAEFIPDNARDCSAQAAGCDEFTNLDRIGEGAEAREYYSYLKQCVDPGDTWPASSCQGYYTWEGSADTGYQLRVFMLATDGGGAPYLTNNSGVYDGLTCDETTYDLETNPMCREFFTNTGARYYHFYPYTITCSSDCHPYRRSEQNTMADIGTAINACQIECGANANCLSLCNNSSCAAGASDNDRTCVLASGEAMFCKNGGFWRSDHQACLYMAVSDEGTRCGAGEVGCREYSGNMGNNMRVILRDNFEGSTQSWAGVGATAVSLSSNALMVGGESLAINGGSSQISKIVGTTVRQNKTYVLQFLAQAASNPVSLTADLGGISFVGSADLDVGLWDIYELNLPDLDTVIDDATVLQISGNGDFFIDDIRLVEIIDRYFVIKDSWHTPDVCYEDIVGNYRGTTFNLGCDIYSDRDSNIHYLHGFTRLCDESAVGCELMIDTYNYTDYIAAAWNDGGDGSCAGDGRDCIVVPADEYKFVVYDPDKLCNSADQGCQLLGSGKQYGDYITYSPVYLKNDPNDYDTILCEEAAKGCESWTAPDYTAYFKDPLGMSCEWREPQATTSVGSSWFKLPVKRCDDDDNGEIGVSPGPLATRVPLEPTVCQTDNDCNAGISCINDNNDYLCPMDTIKTIGYGGQGNRVSQPTMDADAYNWAGFCPASDSGCSEYIDPVSSFGTNVIFNADFTQDVDNNGPDGWSSAGEQVVNTESFTLYRLSGQNNSGTLTLSCANPIFVLNDMNVLAAVGNNLSLNLSNTDTVSRLIYVGDNMTCTIELSSLVGEVDLKEAVIDYQIRQKVDKEGCNGLVDFETGCVLFNERAHNGALLSGFVWDADLTIDDADGVSPRVGGTGENDANIILKVSPNRVCDKWLTCRSYIKDENGNNVCFDIGLCDSVDENGNCNNLLLADKENQTYTGSADAEAFNNLTGYAKVGHSQSSFKGDFYPLGAMKQEGVVARVPNGSFEIIGDNRYPLGWSSGAASSWNRNEFVVINNPVSAEKEGIDYPMVGSNFLKIGSSHSAISEKFDLASGIEYSLTANINTVNLSEGTAIIRLEYYDSEDDLISISGSILSQPGGEDWSFKKGSFTVPDETVQIRIILSAQNSALGRYYFDDINIGPVLKSQITDGDCLPDFGYCQSDNRCSTNNLIPCDPANDVFLHTPQTCRLYPQSDALSCDYIEDSGKRQKGWQGYCLEYDQYPGDENTCLMWYPVDKVIGSGIEEGGGYIYRSPLYYCVRWNTPSSICASTDCYCTRIARTVNSTGENKYWSGRVYEGSDYISPDGYDFLSDRNPFGAAVPPETSWSKLVNPYEWGSAIFWGSSGTRMGQPHTDNDVKRLFAKSYGVWDWSTTDTTYISMNNLYAWNPPDMICNGLSRPGFDPVSPGTTAIPGCDYCAIPPIIPRNSIKANNQAGGGIVLSVNGFVNLKFNSIIDSQQLPLIMYGVDWRDNEFTTVSGVEMRGRPSEDNPHSLFHLYNYWDLLAKRSVNQGVGANNVYCAQATQVPQNFDGNFATGVVCGSDACCAIKPRVRIQDNWGWCSRGYDSVGNYASPAAAGDCDQWEEFNGWVIITETKAGSAAAPACLPNCDCASAIYSGDTCDDGCGGTCNGTGAVCAETCATFGYVCGTQTICGCAENCGTCDAYANSYCSSDGMSCGCTADTCSTLGYNCDTWDNGCGGTTGDCGLCASLSTATTTLQCVAGTCTCIPTCSDCDLFGEGDPCGGDGCGGNCDLDGGPVCPGSGMACSNDYGGCCVFTIETTPYLFTYVKNQYLIENDVMNTFYQAGDMSIVDTENAYKNNDLGTKFSEKDYYQLTIKPEIINNEIKLRIKEIEPEESNIDKIQLIKVIHDKESTVFAETFSQMHNIVLIETSPISCIDESGFNCLDTIKQGDNKNIRKGAGDFIELVFESKDIKKDSYVYINSWRNEFVPKIINFPALEGEATGEKGCLNIEIYKNGNWEQVSRRFHPRAIRNTRTISSGVYWPLAGIEQSGKESLIKLKINWTGIHVVDKVSIVSGDEKPFSAENLELLSAEHSQGGDITENLLEKDYVYGHTVRGDSIDLVFDAGKLWPKENEKVDYFFVSEGFYHGLRAYLYPEVDTTDSYIDEINEYIKEYNDFTGDDNAMEYIDRPTVNTSGNGFIRQYIDELNKYFNEQE